MVPTTPMKVHKDTKNSESFNSLFFSYNKFYTTTSPIPKLHNYKNYLTYLNNANIMSNTDHRKKKNMFGKLKSLLIL